jgi:hypothetical protein
MKQKALYERLSFTIYFILFLSEIAFAGVPIPWGAKLIRDDIAVTGSGEERKIASYETKASKQELLNYYLKEMPGRGYSLFMNGEQNLIFRKAEELVIVVVPSSWSGKTNFMVSTASMKTAAEMTNPYGGTENCEPVPSVPAYPGARCMNSTRLKSGGSRSAAYSTEDSGSVVLNFYRAQMPRYNWLLDKEINLEDIMQKAMQQGQQKVVMTPKQEAAIRDLYGSAQGLVFTNQEGNRCSVHVMNNPATKGALINIVYEKDRAPVR